MKHAVVTIRSGAYGPDIQVVAGNIGPDVVQDAVNRATEAYERVCVFNRSLGGVVEEADGS